MAKDQKRGDLPRSYHIRIKQPALLKAMRRVMATQPTPDEAPQYAVLRKMLAENGPKFLDAMIRLEEMFASEKRDMRVLMKGREERTHETRMKAAGMEARGAVPPAGGEALPGGRADDLIGRLLDGA